MLDRLLLGNSAQAWLIAIAIAAGLFALLMVARRVLVARLGALAARTPNRIDDLVVALIGGTRALVLLFVSLHLASRWLILPPRVDDVLLSALELVALVQAALWGSAAVTFWAKDYLERRGTASDRVGVAMIHAIGVAVKLVVWILVIVTALEWVFKIAVAGLLTGISIGGVALALAVQNILGDLLAALAIVFDQPFDVGDTIQVDQIIGTVEHIGLKTTRLRSQSGEQVIIGNADLLKSRLRNHKRMYQRRAVFTLDLVYDTPPDVMARVPTILREIVGAQSPVKFDRSHFAAFAESALRVETVYYVLDPDYARYMDVQHAINVEVLRRFAAERIQFAFPTRRVLTEAAAE
jgi:small-conductance mechanosensitive channel